VTNSSALEVTRTLDILAPREKVWAALTVPALINEWFGDESTFEPTVGATGSLTWADFGSYRLVIEEVDEPTLLAYRWARSKDVDPDTHNSTHVRFTLEDLGGSTRLTVVETGWESLEGDIEKGMAENTAGWHDELNELRAVLELQDSQ